MSLIDTHSHIYYDQYKEDLSEVLDRAAEFNVEKIICVAVDITLPTEYIQTKTAAQWQRVSIDLHKRPCIFIISGNR